LIAQIFQYRLDATKRGMQVALGLKPRQPQDHITLLAEQPVTDDVVGAVTRFALFQTDHQPCVMLDKIQGEGAERRLAAEADAFHLPQPRPQPALQRVAGAERRFPLHLFAFEGSDQLHRLVQLMRQGRCPLDRFDILAPFLRLVDFVDPRQCKSMHAGNFARRHG
jgi:hypothetical protein